MLTSERLCQGSTQPLLGRESEYLFTQVALALQTSWKTTVFQKFRFVLLIRKCSFQTGKIRVAVV